MEYNVGARVSVKVELKGVRHWTEYFGYRATTVILYKMQDSDGRVLVWKTSGCMVHEKIVDGECIDYFPKEGDVVEIKGTVKAFGEYKGEPQVELNRVKVVQVIEKALTKEEKEQIKREEQKASLNEGDFVWKMPYKQYKEHYADCETVAGSFERHRDGSCVISVIIREGRLKASGTRGQHFDGYRVRNTETGEYTVYKAVSEENAVKRAAKEFGGEWECDHVYRYERDPKYWY